MLMDLILISKMEKNQKYENLKEVEFKIQNKKSDIEEQKEKLTFINNSITKSIESS